MLTAIADPFAKATSPLVSLVTVEMPPLISSVSLLDAAAITPVLSTAIKINFERS